MNPFNAQIKAAIDNFDVPQARDLLREALQHEPDAETYYLAAQVALSVEQQQSFLEKAVALDPFYAAADAALTQLRAAPGSAPAATPPPGVPKPQAVAAPASAAPAVTDDEAAIRQKIANLQRTANMSIFFALIIAFGSSIVFASIIGFTPGLGSYDYAIAGYLKCLEMRSASMRMSGMPSTIQCDLRDPTQGIVIMGLFMFFSILFMFIYLKIQAKKELTRLQAQLAQS